MTNTFRKIISFEYLQLGAYQRSKHKDVLEPVEKVTTAMKM